MTETRLPRLQLGATSLMPRLSAPLEEIPTAFDGTEDQEEIRERLRDEIVRVASFRDECGRTGRYDEAETADHRIELIKAAIEHTIEHELVARQSQEKTQQKDEQKRMFETFVQLWDKRLTDFEARASDERTKLSERHQAEMASFWDAVEAHEEKPKFSSVVISRRATEKALVKQRQYQQAEHVRREAERLEAKELEAYRQQQTLSMARAEEKLQHALSSEREALEAKIIRHRREGLRKRADDYEKLLRYFQNNQTDLSLRLAQERNEMKKTVHLMTSMTPVKGSPSRPSSARSRPRTPRRIGQGIDLSIGILGGDNASPAPSHSFFVTEWSTDMTTPQPHQRNDTRSPRPPSAPRSGHGSLRKQLLRQPPPTPTSAEAGGTKGGDEPMPDALAVGAAIAPRLPV